MAKKQKKQKKQNRQPMPPDKKAAYRGQIRKMLKNERHIMADEIIDNIFYAFMLIVYDEFKCDAKTLKSVADRVLLQFDCVEFGSVALADFAQYMEEKAGFTIANKHTLKDMIPNFGNIKKIDTLLNKISELQKTLEVGNNDTNT